MEKLDPDRVARLLGGWASGSAPIYAQLAEALTRSITRGEVRDGTVLPPERLLARTLAVSRGTVVRAYALLQEQGLLARRQGSGSVVTVREVPGPSTAHRATPLFDESASTVLLKAVPRSIVDLPTELAALAASAPSADQDLQPEGLPALRAAIAERYTAQGLPTAPEQILVTDGTQHGCTLALRGLCRPGDVVLTEALTWPGLIDAVTALGARAYGIPLDGRGVRTDELRAAVERLRPAAVFLNPHHHNPTGTRLSEQRRQEVADLAGDYGVPVVEDRAFASLAFDRRVPLPIAAARPDAPILTVDSLSKVVWDGLRLGWLRASADLVGRLRLVRAVEDLGTAVPSQLLGLQLLPRLDDLLAERVTELAAKAAAAQEVVGRLLPDWSVAPVVGGGALWVTIPASARAFAAHAARRGVLVVTDETFATGESPDRHLRLPFTGAPDVVADALERLAAAWADFDPAMGPPASVAGLVV